MLQLLAAAWLAVSPAYPPELDRAFAQLYSCEFPAAHATVDGYLAKHPDDSLGHAVKGAAYLYSELDRLGVLESEFFESNSRIGDKNKLKPDPRVKAGFEQAMAKSQAQAEDRLKRDANDRNALFAMCLSVGEQFDYMALIEKKQLASLAVNKRAYRYAKRLLAVDPGSYDSYLTTGFTEYVIGDMPFVFRWLVRFDDVQGNKDQGVKNLQLVAEKGHYLKPLAKILLAAVYLRDKRFAETKKLLQDLTREFPANPLLRKELAKISSKAP